ncbi:MAG: SLBB domain-containing protein, partial [Clostridia bacterium]|nr:SLBB domain-containing protein [Clostridia bacterium]
LPSVYPQGAEKVLVYNTTGKVIGEGMLPIDAGVIVINCTTLASIASYVRTGMPLVEKCVTVDGSAVKEPKNVIVPIGTPVADVFEFCGGFKEEPAKVIYGGPMMGISIAELTVPVTKQTNALIALNEKEASPKKTTSCIRCGRCTNACPFGLAPVSFAKALEQNDMEEMKRLHANLCMECGCCAYVCPAGIPLVQKNKLAKAALADYTKKEKEEKK